MLKPVKLIALAHSTYCLISTENDWDEGNALDMRTKEIIYYNGDYGEERPEYIKQVVALSNEIGWVRHVTDGRPFVSKFDEVLYYVIPVLELRNGNCFVEENKIDNKFIINIQ